MIVLFFNCRVTPINIKKQTIKKVPKMWHMGEGSSYSSKQCATFDQDREGQFTKAKVKVKKLTTKAALTAHILSETTSMNIL